MCLLQHHHHLKSILLLLQDLIHLAKEGGKKECSELEGVFPGGVMTLT